MHEEVETFVSKIAGADMLVEDIKSAGNYEGALNVEYNQFAKLYEFIAHLEKRFNHPFKLILITLNSNSGEDFFPRFCKGKTEVLALRGGNGI